MNNLKTKRFYCTGFIPLSNDKSREKQSLESQLITGTCFNLSRAQIINNYSSLMYPIKLPKVEYNLPPINEDESCLEFLNKV
jgi:hypothetical protein